MKKLILISSLALILAVVLSLAARPVPIEQRLVTVHAADVLEDFPELDRQPIEVQAFLLDIANDRLLLLKAEAALLRYPDMAHRLLPMYGPEPEFQNILRRYGEHALPPIQYFVNHPIRSIEWMRDAAEQYEAIKRFIYGEPSSEAPEDQTSASGEQLTPKDRGWYAINFIQSEGHDFLGQFNVDAQGVTHWIATERVLEGLNQFFTSGIRDLEIKYRADEPISAGDIGWASVDVLLFASATKILRLGRTAAVTTRGASRGTRTAALAARANQSARMVLSSARYAKWPVIIGAGYLVMSHPSLINDLFVELADIFGIPALAVQILGWFLLLLPALYLARWLLWLIAPLLSAALRVVQYWIGVLSGRESRQTAAEPKD
ncbi:hypothetical protein LPB19_16675 [Marinobacter salinisoli]|uniref:CHASE2 domain-containing protein n=1 Tax=Marinobacter salinisoli TaxID=2769486 RepID=A0ABX7MUM8_9GAMM|nr:hypothetical protein [Marinobacter salinisoli]QSP94781.1 hypothetical protein LPB19_16675 [Marinobacter salinisoli]